MYKRSIRNAWAFLLIPALVVQMSVVSPPAWAAEKPQEVVQVKAEAGQISLEKAITTVKSFFTIPTEFTKFTSGAGSPGSASSSGRFFKTNSAKTFC